ncbi:MAG: sigma-70 family RNA polymerase sigma factor [Bacteroidetes bacterium]|nr:sigma-70 family RNA polymerase sigma factor [Bacteroidota bacterium]
METGSHIQNTLDPTKWVELYADYLYKFAYYRVNNDELAQDLVQDCFLAALKASETYKGQASEKTWLVSILKNKIIDHYKKASTRNESPLQLPSYDAPSYDHFFDKNTNGHWRSSSKPKDWEATENNFDTKEFYKVLEGCLQELPEKWKAVLTMSLLDDADSKLVCKEFDLSSSNFWVIIHRAKLQLRACLEKNWLKL